MKGDNWINGFCNSVKYDMRMRWDFGRKIQFILPREREINRSLNQCLLQLWTGSACRMTSRGGDRHWRRNRFIKACSNKFSNKNTIYSKLNKWINQNQCSKHQSSFCLVSLIWNLFLIKVWSPPCHSARSRRRNRRICPSNFSAENFQRRCCLIRLITACSRKLILRLTSSNGSREKNLRRTSLKGA